MARQLWPPNFPIAEQRSDLSTGPYRPVVLTFPPRLDHLFQLSTTTVPSWQLCLPRKHRAIVGASHAPPASATAGRVCPGVDFSHRLQWPLALNGLDQPQRYFAA